MIILKYQLGTSQCECQEYKCCLLLRSIFISNADSLDWKEQGAEAEIRQVLEHKHLGNGSIILFHNDAKYTPKVLDTILKGIKEKGFEIVPISQLIHRENFEMDHEGRQIPKGKDV